MAMATVYETQGSTYSKAGHRILIAANGDYEGLVSGGCLEGDLADRARAVLARDRAAAVSYDMRDEADDLWGLGVGCNGLIRVFLQPLLPALDYEPFAAIAQLALGHEAAAVATVVAPGETGAEPGATLIRRQTGATSTWRLPETLTEPLASGCRGTLAAGRARYAVEAGGLGVLYAPLNPIPRLLVLGAGLDAVPLVSMAADLGWLVSIADHRPAYIARGGFAAAERVLSLDPRSLEREIDLDAYDAVIVMSHHLVTDRIYLEQLSRADLRYIGVLGPPARKARLLSELGPAGEALAGRLEGPVGLDIGADSPESIALAILADLQARLAPPRLEAGRL